MRRTPTLTALAAALALAMPAAGAAFTLAQAVSAPFAWDPAASPAGAKFAWLLNERGRRNVCVAEAPFWRGRRLTAFSEDDGVDLGELAWSADGTVVFFTRGGDLEHEAEPAPNANSAVVPAEQSVWLVRPDRPTPQRIGIGHSAQPAPLGHAVAFIQGSRVMLARHPGSESPAPAVTVRGEITDLSWSPDGAALAFIVGRRDHSLLAVWKVGAKNLRYIDPSTDRDLSPAWSFDSRRIAFIRVPSDASEPDAPHRSAQPFSLRIFDLASGIGREVWRAADGQGSAFHPIASARQLWWTRDGRLIFPWERDGWLHLYSADPSRAGLTRLLTPGEGEVDDVAASADGRALLYASNRDDIDRRHLWRLDLVAGTTTELTGGKSIETDPVPSGEGQALAYISSDAKAPAHLVVRAKAGGPTVPLAAAMSPPGFPGDAFVEPERVIFAATDGMPVHGQLFRPPPGASGARHAALIFLHGGARRQMLLGFHHRYYYSYAYAMNQYLASLGYVVLSVNFRSGIGYGLDFREAIDYGRWGASEFNDVTGAASYLRDRADVVASRIGLWGGSYGGYLTALGLARASSLFAAGVDLHGVHDWSRYIPHPPLAFDPGGEVARSARVAYESSPMASVATWRSPVLLIHGDDDRNVAFSETVRLVEALRAHHVDCEQLVFPDEVHDFLRHRDWIAAYQAAADFFGRKLKAD